ncbi:replication initiation factor domain-containing protein, partial [Streptococcus suis]|uniref:replication initiation factor domain-containing protein n=1 Tax=Streptococcus suis TaxID=1307 RepID=UPI00137B65F7
SMSVTRIDIAMDEMWLGYGHEDEQLDLFTLVEKRRTNEMMFDRIEGFNHIGGGSYSTDKNGNVTYTDNGLSIYCGSRQSTMFFNFYEKRYELAKKERMTVDEALAVFEVWNRYELRFSDTKA